MIILANCVFHRSEKGGETDYLHIYIVVSSHSCKFMYLLIIILFYPPYDI